MQQDINEQEINEIVNDLNQIIYQQKIYEDKINRLFEHNKKLLQDIQVKTNEYNIHVESKDLYTKAVEVIYENSIGQLETILNNGLKYIFYDKDYSIKFEFGTARNKTLDIYLEENGNLINLKKGTGGTARSVISFILLTYYLIAKKSYPVIFLDEMYTQISEAYVEKFFDYVSLLCEQKKFIIVLVTHDIRFMNYADYGYTLADGEIIKYEEKNN